MNQNRCSDWIRMTAQVGPEYAPHANQGLDWADGEDNENFDGLIEKSQSNLINGNNRAGFSGVPELKLIQYNLDTDKLEWADGIEIAESELKSFVKRANDFIAMQYDKKFPPATRSKRDKPTRIGSATVKRAAFIQSLLQSEGGSGSRILAALVRKSGQSLKSIADIFYSKSNSTTTNQHTEQSLLSAMRKAMDAKCR